MKKKNEDFMIKVLSFIQKYKKEGKTLNYISQKIKCQVDTKKHWKKRHKILVYKSFMNFIKKEDVKSIIKSINYVERKTDSRIKIAKFKFTVDQGRKGKRITEHGYTLESKPVIFYLCSEHDKCSDGHQDWQGKIYVDRFWKSLMIGAGCTDEDIYRVKSYIKNHSLLTWQEVVGGKPYLISRPYCTHYMIPLSTDDVLVNSLNKIKKMVTKS